MTKEKQLEETVVSIHINIFVSDQSRCSKYHSLEILENGNHPTFSDRTELLFSLGCIFQTLSLVHRCSFFIVYHFEGILGATYVLNHCFQNTIFNINHFTNQQPVFMPQWDVITHFQMGLVTF